MCVFWVGKSWFFSFFIMFIFDYIQRSYDTRCIWSRNKPPTVRSNNASKLESRVTVVVLQVRLAIAEKGLHCEEYDVSLPLSEHNEPWFMHLNPTGEVPVLVHNDNVICDPTQIMDYLEQNFNDGETLVKTAWRPPKKPSLSALMHFDIGSIQPGFPLVLKHGFFLQDFLFSFVAYFALCFSRFSKSFFYNFVKIFHFLLVCTDLL